MVARPVRVEGSKWWQDQLAARNARAALPWPSRAKAETLLPLLSRLLEDHGGIQGPSSTPVMGNGLDNSPRVSYDACKQVTFSHLPWSYMRGSPADGRVDQAANRGGS